MVTKKSNHGYNERLFSSGLRKMLHLARFRWLAQSIEEQECHYQSVIELGCFDGKVIDFLPVRPILYHGFDANWEGGLDLAKQKWNDEPNFTFNYCCAPGDMDIAGNQFDIAVCMETLEHIPPNLVEDYLDKLAEVTKQYVFVTVPNEKGVVFFLKHLVQKAFLKAHPYTFREFINETLGRVNKVERSQHKGFDYQVIIQMMSTRFDIIHIQGIPFRLLPTWLNFSVGIIGSPKTP